MPSTTASIRSPLPNMRALFGNHPPGRITAGLLVGLSLWLSSCASPLPPTAYRAYLTDPAHGLTHTTEVNGTTITCAYRPTELLVLQDLAGSQAATPATRDSLARAYAGKTYCTLTLARNGSEVENQFINDPARYQQAISYLNTGIAADAVLATTPQDSVAAVASMYVRQYGTTGHSTVLLVFDTHQLMPQQGFHLTLRGQRLELGTIQFAFAAADLAALPALQFE
jgi:hypothetical protein